LSEPIKLQKGQLLFREGDSSEAMFVLKKGRIAITKTKGDSEIELATVAVGQIFGEMAFFDQKPRSANARALQDSEIIALPFKSLQAQFKLLPEWLKSMVKSINENLREANKRIKVLERVDANDNKQFPPHTITKLCAIISFVSARYGEKKEKGLVLNWQTLRNYTIQVFQEPTTKMEKLITILQGMGLTLLEDLGEGRKQVTVIKHDFLMGFVEFYNDWLFKEESKRINIVEKDLPILKALLFYGRKATLDEKTKKVKVNLNSIQNESMKDLGYVVSVNDYAAVIEKKITEEKSSEQDGVYLSFDLNLVEKIYPYWELIFAIEKNDRR
jgi:CRP-like cAMP-binding protein